MRISLTLPGVDPAFTPRLFSPCGILNIRKLTSGQLRPILLSPEPGTPQSSSHHQCPSPGHTESPRKDFRYEIQKLRRLHRARPRARNCPPRTLPCQKAAAASKTSCSPALYPLPLSGARQTSHLALARSHPLRSPHPAGCRPRLWPLVALSLAACISSGSPLPDGTPTQQ